MSGLVRLDERGAVEWASFATVLPLEVRAHQLALSRRGDGRKGPPPEPHAPDPGTLTPAGEVVLIPSPQFVGELGQFGGVDGDGAGGDVDRRPKDMPRAMEAEWTPRSHRDVERSWWNALLNRAEFQEQYQHWSGTFCRVPRCLRANPAMVRNAYQRLYDAIIAHGFEKYRSSRRSASATTSSATPSTRAPTASSGSTSRSCSSSTSSAPPPRAMAPTSASCCSTARSAQQVHHRAPAQEGHRALLAHARGARSTPSRGCSTSGARSRPARAPARGRQDARVPCPMHEEPLVLVPVKPARRLLAKLNATGYKPKNHGGQAPRRGRARPLLPQDPRRPDAPSTTATGSASHGARPVRRIVLSEKDRVGIGTFQPKDEKNQDSTELTGDINYRKIAHVRQRFRPARLQLRRRAQHRQPRHLRVHRGPQARRRVPLRPARREQEHTIKPKKFAQTYIDEVILGHTNEPEYKRLQNNEMMEAFRDRTIKIDVPYNIRLDDEIKIYQKDFGPSASRTSTSPRTRSRSPRCGPCSRASRSPRRPA
jgi:serine protein kinase